MSIRLEKKLIAYESVSMTPIDPSCGFYKETKVKEYLKEHPMPHNEVYSEDDLIYDLCKSSGMLCFPNDLKEETIDYIETLMNELF